MVTKNLISLVLFILFIFSYSVKLIIQSRRNKINAYVLGQGNKTKQIRGVEQFVRISTFIWGITWVVQAFFQNQINKYIGLIIEVDYRLGLAIIALGLMTFIKAMVDMKSSWRVGIDKETKSSLITYGIYRYSRNPAFVGFDLMFMGLFLTYPNILTLIVAFTNVIGLHLLIMQEEKHLKSMFGNAYLEYMQKTPRYFGL
ncbi:MAG TPA: isoprenylcysteine carboxylmethyltransferase family protein [Bacillota bacterium]|nr:isoprenylcysteine carboxylmethyltransferase family protein [Bacillota bacterium]